MTKSKHWYDPRWWGTQADGTEADANGALQRALLQELCAYFKANGVTKRAERLYDPEEVERTVYRLLCQCSVANMEIRRQNTLKLFDYLATWPAFLADRPILARTLRRKMIDFDRKGQLPVKWHYERIFGEPFPNQ